MNASKLILKAADSLVSAAVILFLAVAGLYSAYALWDNAQVYAAVDNVQSELLALNIYNTFYGRAGWEGVGQAKAVIFFIIVGVIALIQNKLTTSKEVQQ